LGGAFLAAFAVLLAFAGAFLAGVFFAALAGGFSAAVFAAVAGVFFATGF
jgi:hypothetical protein